MTLKIQDKLISESTLHTNWLQKLKKLMRFQSSSKPFKETNDELNKYKLVLEQAPGSVFIMDKHMNFEYINPCFTQLTGYTKEDLLHKNINDTLYKGNIPESRTEVSEALRKGEKWQGELLTWHKSGKPYWANTIAAPYKDESGNIEGYIIIQQDITEHKNMEVSLRESENLYRTLIEESIDGIAITQNAKIILVNNAFCEMLGYTREEILQFNAPDLLAPEDRERVIDIHYKRMRGEIETINYTAKFLHKNGSTLTVEMNAATVQVNGQSASFTTMRDITRRLAMEQALRESELKYKTLVENSQDCITIIRDNKFLFANNTFCKMLHYTPDELYNMPAVNTLYPSDREKALKVLERRRNGDFSTINDVMLFQTKEGETRECETSSTMIEYDGEWASFYTSHDITESKRMQDALRRSEQKYRELTEMLPQAVYELDAQGKPTYMNMAGLKSFGLEKGQKIDKVFDLFIPEDRQRMNKALEEEAARIVTDNCCTHSEPSEPIEYTAKRIDGTTFPVIIYGTSIVENCKVVGSRGIIVDISERKAMENALRESEEKYKTLVENSQDGITIIKNNRILFANNTYCKMLGYTRDELYNMPSVATLHPVERERTLKMSERRQNGDFSTINDVMLFQTKEGEIKECETSSTVVEYEGQWVSFFTSHDITESKRMQLELKESEEKYRQLFTAESDAIFMIDADTGKILDANPASSSIYGYSRDELISMRNVEVSAEPEKTVKTTQQKLSEVPLRYHKKKDGTVFPVELSAGFTTFKNKNIQIVTSRDITERVQIQEALSRSEEKYRSLIEKATDGIVITQDGLLKFANNAMCDMLRYPWDEITNIPFLKLVVEEEKQVMIDYHKRRMAGENFNSLYRSRIICKDGTIVTVELNSRTIDYFGKPASFIIIRDITDRIQIEEELRQAKQNLELLNHGLEQRVKESSESLTEARTQLINLQKENLQSQFDVLRQQVNPHFLFNSLNVLTSLIKLEPDLAEKFSEHLSKVYRYVLENKDNELVDLNTELNFLDAYIFLLNIRFVGKLKVNINIPETRRNDQLIPLAMQLLIENAIKHNIMSKTEPLIIDIYIDNDNFLNIVNNLQERPSQLISTGVGLKNIQNRYLLLNNTQPVFEKTVTHFIAKVPLVRID